MSVQIFYIIYINYSFIIAFKKILLNMKFVHT
jgi:uncharacterized membrane protein (DUF485 family)